MFEVDVVLAGCGGRVLADLHIPPQTGSSGFRLQTGLERWRAGQWGQDFWTGFGRSS